MPRRSKSPLKPLWLVLAAVLIIGAFLGAGLFRSGDRDAFRTIAPLDVGSYLQNANSLRGNVYKVEGEVSNSLAWSPTSGRLIAVDVEDGVIPVLVTPEFNKINIQKGQRFLFVIEVDEKGLLRTQKLSKT